MRREDRRALPAMRFALSSADAMTPDQPFAGPFDITARLSKSGDCHPRQATSRALPRPWRTERPQVSLPSRVRE